MDEKNRSVRFANQLNDTEIVTIGDRLTQLIPEKKPPYEATKDAIRWALDAAGNTGQYIRYVNMKIDKHHEQIKHIEKLHQKFDREISMLQSQKLEKIDYDKNSLGKMDTKTITSILDQLLLGKRNTKTKLRKLENECALAEKELEQQEIQIEEVRDNLKVDNSHGTNTFDIANKNLALKTIKEELHFLSRENDVKKLSDAIDIIASALGSKY